MPLRKYMHTMRNSENNPSSIHILYARSNITFTGLTTKKPKLTPANIKRNVTPTSTG